jgi:hypothetical protein
MQKLNCKPGDLAIVVSAEQQQNIGQIVEVLGPPTGKPFNLPGHHYVWQVRAVSGRATLHYRHADGRLVQHVEGPAPDFRLRPVSGLDDGEKAQEDVAVGKTAPRRKRRKVELVEVS